VIVVIYTNFWIPAHQFAKHRSTPSTGGACLNFFTPPAVSAISGSPLPDNKGRIILEHAEAPPSDPERRHLVGMGRT
jgi:hypothetical protein